MQGIDDSERDHLLWLSSSGQEGRRAHFAGEDLRGVSFAGRQLSQANFRGAQLEGADFSGADITFADFTEAQMQAVVMKDVQAHGAVFKMTHAQRMRIASSDFSNSNWHGADAQNAVFEAVQWADAEFREATLDNSQWRDCACVRMGARAASMQHVVLQRVDFEQADLRELRGAHAQFEDVVFKDTECRGASFDAAQFLRTDVAHARELAPEWQSLARGSLEAALEKERAQLAQEKTQVLRDKEATEKLKAEVELVRADIRTAQQQVDQQMLDVKARAASLDGQSERLVIAGGMCKRYSRPLMIIAALWCIVSSMIITVILYQISLVGFDKLKLLEIGVVAGAVVALLLMHSLSAMFVFKAGRALDEVSPAAPE